VQAAGRTSKEIAYSVKAMLERRYYYNADGHHRVDHISERSRGKFTSSVRPRPGRRRSRPMKNTPSARRSSALVALGISPTRRRSKVTRKNGQAFVVNLKDVIERGRSEGDVVVQPDDQIYVPQRLVNF
jgi:protein involved in polysaccharide export with SLBB domain